MFRHVHIWDSGYIRSQAGVKEEKNRRFIYVVNEDTGRCVILRKGLD